MMTKQWTVWCDSCQNWDTATGNKRTVERIMKNAGWKKHKERRHLGGTWTCPECKKEGVK